MSCVQLSPPAKARRQGPVKSYHHSTWIASGSWMMLSLLLQRHIRIHARGPARTRSAHDRPGPSALVNRLALSSPFSPTLSRTLTASAQQKSNRSRSDRHSLTVGSGSQSPALVDRPVPQCASFPTVTVPCGDGRMFEVSRKIHHNIGVCSTK